MKNNKFIALLFIAVMAIGTMNAAVTSRLRITLTGDGSAYNNYVTIRQGDEAAFATAFPNTGSSTAYDIDVKSGSDYYAEWQQTDLTNTMIAVNPAVGTTTFTLTFNLGTSNTETFTFFDNQSMTTPIVITNNMTYPVTITTATAREWIENRFYINYNPAEIETLPGKVGTFIRNKNVVDVQGGLFYEIIDGNVEQLTFQSLADEDHLDEATPVLYVADATGSMKVTYGDDVYAGDLTATITRNGMVGLIAGSQVCSNASGTDAALINSSGCLVYAGSSFSLTQGHAYIDLTNLPSVAPAPARRRLVIGRQGIATAIEEMPVMEEGTKKVMENGVLYIVKDGVKYDAMGQVVK